MAPSSRRLASLVLALAAAIAVTACNKEKKDGPESPEPAAKTPPPDPEPPDSEPPPEDEKPAPPESPTGACDTLDRNECISALHCTMHWVATNKYECRPSKGPCEADLMQSDKPTCESREGCVWDPGECYCRFPGYGQTQVPDKNKNAGGACACGGGPPPLCKAK